MRFTNLVVKKWDGDKWPENRISIGCKDDVQAVAISPRYAELNVADRDFEEIAMRVNNHERLVEALRDLYSEFPITATIEEWEAVERARTLLATLEAGKGGE